MVIDNTTQSKVAGLRKEINARRDGTFERFSSTVSDREKPATPQEDLREILNRIRGDLRDVQYHDANARTTRSAKRIPSEEKKLIPTT